MMPPRVPMVDQQNREVYLSLRDIVAITGLFFAVIGAAWGFTSDVRATLAKIGEQMRSVDDRVRSLESAVRRPIRDIRLPEPGE